MKMYSLVRTEELKTNLLAYALIKPNAKPDIFYNDMVGSVTVWLAGEHKGIVHYLNHSFALVYDEDTKEIIGIRIEGIKINE